jgi:hypothetical protein
VSGLSHFKLHQERVWRNALPIFALPVEEHRCGKGQLLGVLCHLDFWTAGGAAGGAWAVTAAPWAAVSAVTAAIRASIWAANLLSGSPRGFSVTLPPAPLVAPAPCEAVAPAILTASALWNCSCTYCKFWASVKLGISGIGLWSPSMLSTMLSLYVSYYWNVDASGRRLSPRIGLQMF